MYWQHHPVTKMLYGTRREKITSVWTVATWFCMGAFAASTIEYHMDLLALSEQGAALVGGTAASVLALVVKAV
jgi:hypothetical protein